MAAFDRDLGTAWQAAPDDKQPSITIGLPESRTLRGIRLVNRDGLNASSPLELQVQAGGELFTGFTDQRGLFRFNPVEADEVEVTFLSGNQVRIAIRLGRVRTSPRGVSEVALIGADDLRRALPMDEQLSLPCGIGPDVVIDGDTVSRTSVSGRVEDFMRGRTLNAQACSEPMTIPAGEHRVEVVSSTAFQPLVAAFAPEQEYGPTGRPESPSIQTWDATKRTAELPQSDQNRVLELAENFNPGWSATVGDQALAPLRVDGWKQAFVVPAGVSGPTTITFAPNSTYRWGLLAGLVGVLVVLGLALRPPRTVSTAATSVRALPRVLTVLVGLAVVLVLGPWGLLAWAVATLLVRRLNLPVVAFVAVTVAVLLSAVAGVRPASVVVVLQGCALATALAALAWAAQRDRTGASADGATSGSSAAPDVR